MPNYKLAFSPTNYWLSVLLLLRFQETTSRVPCATWFLYHRFTELGEREQRERERKRERKQPISLNAPFLHNFLPIFFYELPIPINFYFIMYVVALVAPKKKYYIPPVVLF